MAPPPEYDKEPKAPDKSVTTMTNDDSKILHTIVNDQQANSDHKPTNPSSNIDIDKNKVEKCVENLDDGRLRALLDEAITYKNPKDREGKSDLFKELLEKAEQQDDQSEAAARGLSGSRARHGGGGPRGGRHALPHSNSLQDIVAAALAAEPAPRRQRHHAPPAPVSTRAIQGGSLPSGVDTSFLLGEEPGRGAGYLATVRCVNPPPLAERRVSASDANCPAEVEVLHRRSKPVLPMTYTARATLEIGSGSVCSGRAVTTTTASNQVRTAAPARLARSARQSRSHPALQMPGARDSCRPPSTCGPPERLFKEQLYHSRDTKDTNQSKLMNALSRGRAGRGGARRRECDVDEGKECDPRGPPPTEDGCRPSTEHWMGKIDKWYEGLDFYLESFQRTCAISQPLSGQYLKFSLKPCPPTYRKNVFLNKDERNSSTCLNVNRNNIIFGNCGKNALTAARKNSNQKETRKSEFKESHYNNIIDQHQEHIYASNVEESDISLRKRYRETVGKDFEVPSISVNPKRNSNMSMDNNQIHEGKMHYMNKRFEERISNKETDKNNELLVLNTYPYNAKSEENLKNTELGVISIKKEENIFEISTDENYKSNDFVTSFKSTENLNTIEMVDMANSSELGGSVYEQELENNLNTIGTELIDFIKKQISRTEEFNSFAKYYASHQKLIQAMEATNNDDCTQTLYEESKSEDISKCSNKIEVEDSKKSQIVLQMTEKPNKGISDKCLIAELTNNAYVLLPVPGRSLDPIRKQSKTSQILELNETEVDVTESKSATAIQKKKILKVAIDNAQKKDDDNKAAFKLLLFEKLNRDSIVTRALGDKEV